MNRVVTGRDGTLWSLGALKSRWESFRRGADMSPFDPVHEAVQFWFTVLEQEERDERKLTTARLSREGG